jgi:malonyl-CoA O-methyltransferase
MQVAQTRSPLHWPHTGQGAGQASGRPARFNRGLAPVIMASIYCAAMINSPAVSPSARALDERAAARLRARLASQPQAPWLHTEVASRMAERLAVMRTPPARVLDWSGPAGGSEPALLAACPKAQMAVVHGPAAHPGEASTRPDRAWWRRFWPASQRGPAHWAPDQVPQAGFDMVWSSMALQWEGDPPALMRRWRQALAPEGFLMFSTLGPGTLAGLRDVYREARWGSPMAPLVDMHDLGDMLVEAGFADPVMDQEVLTLTWADPDALLAELRTLGGNLDPARSAGCRTPRWRQRLHHALAERADAQGRIALQIEVVYGHAFRAADAGPRVAAQTEIGLDEMRLMLRKPGRRGELG